MARLTNPSQQTPLLHAAWTMQRVQRPGVAGPEAACPRSQAAFSSALPAAMHRAAPSFTRPRMLPAGADAAGAAAAVPRLDLIGIEICGITRSSGRWLPGSLAFSAAVMALLRTGSAFDAAVMGRGAEAGDEGDDEGGAAG